MGTEEDPGAGPPASTSVDLARSSVPDDVSQVETDLDSGGAGRRALLGLPEIERCGPYALLGRIASGCVAEVFLARARDSDGARRLVVVERVLPHVAEERGFVETFREEARLAMQLDHPHICGLHAFGEVDGRPYLVTEWVDGQPLSKILRRARGQGGVPVAVVLRIVAQAAEALDSVHRARSPGGAPLGIVHRDVSPRNIMVSYDGVVKVRGFGVAGATDRCGRVDAGDLAYLSPQQCVREPVDVRADVFALGVCLFEALTGKNPFRRKTELETMTKILGDARPDLRARLPDAPEELAVILDKALKRAPQRRYHSCGEMQLDLEQALALTHERVDSARLGRFVTSLFPGEARDGPALELRFDRRSSHPEVTKTADEQRRRSSWPGSAEPDAPAPAPSASKTMPANERTAAAIGALVLLAAVGTAVAAATWSLFDLPRPGSRGRLAERSSTPARAARAELAAPEVGSIFVGSDPPGASVTLDGERVVGQTPLEIEAVEPGVHELTLRLLDHEPWRGRVVIEARRRAAIAGDLMRSRSDPRPARDGPSRLPGQLSLNTRPWSKVYLGRRLLGTTPIGRVEVPSGHARLRFVDRDGNEHRRAVRVPPGEHVTESFNLRE